MVEINGFSHSQIAYRDFYNGSNDLNFENPPAKSPEYEKLLFGKVMLQLTEEQNYPDPQRLSKSSKISPCSVRNCTAS